MLRLRLPTLSAPLLACALVAGCGSSEPTSAEVNAGAEMTAEAEFHRLRQLERGCCDAID
jgi:hypothetical protein